MNACTRGFLCTAEIEMTYYVLEIQGLINTVYHCYSKFSNVQDYRGLADCSLHVLEVGTTTRTCPASQTSFFLLSNS
jgi:hypothetical protein